MEDKEILDHKIGDRSIRELSAIEFMQWLSKKIDNSSAVSAAVTELRLAVTAPVIAHVLEEAEKIRLVRKLLSLNIKI